MKHIKRKSAESKAQYGPRLAGEILHDYLENSDEPLARAYRKRKAKGDGWHANTHPCAYIKTLLRSDRQAREGKNYQGMLRRDVTCEEFRYDEHFTFIETAAETYGKRNPHVFVGKYVTITRRDDGSLHLNFRNVAMDRRFNVRKYAAGVAAELRQALSGLVGEVGS